jgi:hypothetical protein
MPNIFKNFIAYKLVAIIFVCKTAFVDAVYMLPYSLFQIISNPYVKNGVMSISHDIDIAVHNQPPNQGDCGAKAAMTRK